MAKKKKGNDDQLENDMLLDKLADLLLADSQSAAEADEIEEIAEEIMLKADSRDSYGMQHPVPVFLSREKLLAVTERFGLELFGDLDEKVIASLDLPLANRFAADVIASDFRDGNTYREALKEAEVLDSRVRRILEIAGEADAYKNYHLDEILHVLKVCDACCEAGKRDGILECLYDLIIDIFCSADGYMGARQSEIMAEYSKGEEEMSRSEAILTVHQFRMNARKAAMMLEAYRMAQIEEDQLAANMITAAMAADAILAVDDMQIDIEELNSQELTDYLEIKRDAYEILTDTISLFVGLESFALDVASLGIYTDYAQNGI